MYFTLEVAAIPSTCLNLKRIRRRVRPSTRSSYFKGLPTDASYGRRTSIAIFIPLVGLKKSTSDKYFFEADVPVPHIIRVLPLVSLSYLLVLVLSFLEFLFKQIFFIPSKIFSICLQSPKFRSSVPLNSLIFLSDCRQLMKILLSPALALLLQALL